MWNINALADLQRKAVGNNKNFPISFFGDTRSSKQGKLIKRC